MRVLVTRPLEDVGPLVAALRARGHAAMVEPMLSIERRADVAVPLPLDGVQALLFTSANGVRAFADLAPERDLPVFAVGDASATAARDAGFATVESAGGDVADLARLVAATLDPGQGPLFHPAASQLAGDLQGALEDAGFTLRRAALYEAQPAVELSPTLRRALADGDLDAAVFFSPRTARTFVGLIERAGLGTACARLQAVCLSEAVATRLNALTWARVLVAARPEQDAVLARLDEAAAEISARAPESPPPAPDAALNAPDVIAAFGGIRPMASKLGVAVSTVQGWRERGSIPAARHAHIAAVAKSHGVQLDAAVRAPKTDSPPAAKEAPLPSRDSQARPDAAAAPAPEATARPAAPLARAPSARLWGTVALGVVAVVVGAGVAIVGRDVWLADPPAPVAEVADTAAMANLETRLAAVEGDVRDRTALTEIEDELLAIQDRLNELVTDIAAAADSPSTDAAAQTAALRDVQTQVQAQVQTLIGRIDALDERLGEVQGQLETVAVSSTGPSTGPSTGGGAQTAGEAALILVVAQLRDAVRGSAPFTAELQAVLDLATSPAFAGGSDLVDALTPLMPHAETGVPVLATLQADFPGVAREIVARASVGRGQGAGDDDWLAGIKRRVSGLISVRPVGQVVGDSPAAIAARAEAALGNDDLAGTVRELSALADPAAGAARDWLAAAKARLAVRTALNRLGRGLIGRLDARSE